jgi:hypothetical protein
MAAEGVGARLPGSSLCEEVLLASRVKLLLGSCLLVGVWIWPTHSFPLFAQRALTVSAPPATTHPVSSTANASSPRTSSAAEDDTSIFIAVRYDNTHVIFRLGDAGDFSLTKDQEKTLRSLPQPISVFGGAPAWELDSQLLQSLQSNFSGVHVGEQWQLELSENSRIPVVIEKPVALVWGCAPSSYTAAFIAEVAPQTQSAFVASPKSYFLVHKSAGAFSPRPDQNPARVRALPAWNPTPEVRAQIEQAIGAQFKDELAREEATGAWREVRKQFEEQATLGQVKLTYETDALQLSPDGFPLLFVRARWMAGPRLAVLMAFWLHVGPTVTGEIANENGAPLWLSKKSPLTKDDVALSQLGSVVNVFDRHGNGYNGEVLVLFHGYEGYNVSLFRVTPTGFVASKISLSEGC